MLLQSKDDLDVFSNETYTLYFTTDKYIHLVQKYPLVYSDIEKSTHLTLHQHQPQQLRQHVHKVILLLATARLLHKTKIVPDARFQHLIKYPLVVKLNYHNLNFFEGRHFHVDSYHCLVEIFNSIFGCFHYSTWVLSFHNWRSERWNCTFVHYWISDNTLAEKHLVDVHFLLDIRTHLLETTFAYL